MTISVWQKAKKPCKHIDLVTHDSLFDEKAYFEVKIVLIHLLQMNANLSILLLTN